MGQHKDPVLCVVEDWTVARWKEKDKKKNQGSWGRVACGRTVGSREFADRVNW